MSQITTTQSNDVNNGANNPATLRAANSEKYTSKYGSPSLETKYETECELGVGGKNKSINPN